MTKKNLLRSALLLCVIPAMGMDCPGDRPGYTPPPPVPKVGIAIASSSSGAYTHVTAAPGETVRVPVSVMALNDTDTSTTVTPEALAGVSFSPASVNLDVPSTTHFDVTFSAEAPLGQRDLTFTRSGPEFGVKRADVPLFLSDKLAAATLNPAESTVAQGGTRIVEVSVLPRGTSSGRINLEMRMRNGRTGLTFSPQTFPVDLVQGSTTPVIVPVSITAASGATLGTESIFVAHPSGGLLEDRHVRGSGSVQIVAGGGEPTFTFTAAPMIARGNNHSESETVVYTLTSVNDYTGTVRINAADGELYSMPSVNNLTFDIAPGTPTVFRRNFYRNADHNNPLTMTYTATDTMTGVSKAVTITVRVP